MSLSKQQGCDVIETMHFSADCTTFAELQENYAKLYYENGKIAEKLKTVETKNGELCAENEALKLKLATMEANLLSVEQVDELKDSEKLSTADGSIVFGRSYYRRKRGTKIEYVICVFNLCSDVLTDVFQFGTRRQLSALEPVGHFFHNLIADRFIERPFLALSLETFFDENVGDDYWLTVGWDMVLSAPGSIFPRENIHDGKVSGVGVYIGKPYRSVKAIFVFDANVGDLPPYLRVENIQFDQHYMDEEQFELISPLVLQFRSAFGSSAFDLYCGDEITNAKFDFILQTLIPLFDCCKQYKFRFSNVTGKAGEASTFLVSLLQLPSIVNASSIDVFFYYPDAVAATQQLSVEGISNWLHKPFKHVNKMTEKRSLHVGFCSVQIENMFEMIEHLKKIFKTAKVPVQPFALSFIIPFEAEKSIMNQTIHNPMSQEEFSVRQDKPEYGRVYITIERSMKMIGK